MNYIQEVHAFYNELEINPLSSSAISLWYALHYLHCKSGRKDKFSVPVGTLSLKSGLSERSVSNARNELKTKGYIDFQSRGGNRAATYHMKPLPANIADKLSGNASDKLSGNASALKEYNSSSTSSSSGNESFYAAHKRVFGFDCNPFQATQLVEFIEQDGMEERVVIRAIERAATVSKGYNFRLIAKILNDYFKSNVMTLEQAVAYDSRYGESIGGQAYPKKDRQAAKAANFAQMARELEHEET